ncbi:hypothetical protein ACNPQM_04250 [Streptomyces sp. NPDC056231]|uniref:hypothetical protein n=1 Tax=Streptomyces sp. NPDC056231 TaxID=3345755 RepID=UPI003AADA954
MKECPQLFTDVTAITDCPAQLFAALGDVASGRIPTGGVTQGDGGRLVADQAKGAQLVFDGDDSDGVGSGPGPEGAAQLERDIADFLDRTGSTPVQRGLLYAPASVPPPVPSLSLIAARFPKCLHS